MAKGKGQAAHGRRPAGGRAVGKTKTRRTPKPAHGASASARVGAGTGAEVLGGEKRAGRAGSRPAQIDTEIQTVSFVSLGCPKNLVDSEKMLGALAADGLGIIAAGVDTGAEDVPVGAAHSGVESEGFGGSSGASVTGAGGLGLSGGADVIVINTCGFLEASKDESLSVIRTAIREKEEGKVKRVVVAGCLVQRHRAKMLEWAPGIDAMVGVFDRDRILEAVRGAKKDRTRPMDGEAPKYWIAANALAAARDRGMATTGLTVNGKDGKGIGYFEDDSARLRLTPRHYAYLRVSEGCNQNCAFCTIPGIRGKMRSKPLMRIAEEARELIADGAFELNLIGQDTTSYGDDLGEGFDAGAGLPAMLRAVNGAFDDAGVKEGWVRLMYAYPSNLADGMIDALAELSMLRAGGGRGASGARRGRIVPYIDIPLQHASDRMLKAMRRNVSATQQRELMFKLRERITGIAIRTTFISGFPGETEKDHEALLAFIEDVGFDAVGVFEYSREEGTAAARMEDDPAQGVQADIKRRRRDEVMALQQRLAFEQASFLAQQFDEARPAESGIRLDVLIDRPTGARIQQTTGVSKGGMLYQGRAYFQAPQVDAVTFVQSRRKLAPGELVPAVIVASDGYDLIARPAEELEKKVGLRILK